MGNIYGYGNQLWKPIHEFEYTGDLREFTLNPGKYLLMCYGAHGGEGVGYPGVVNYGGAAYGVLDLKKRTTFYAAVGGNGENYKEYGFGRGGYNGGGNGGDAYPKYPKGGPGGGGASDIRLSNDMSGISGPVLKPEFRNLPEGYQPTEYVRSMGNAHINTGVIPKVGMTIIIDFWYDSYSSDKWFAGATENGFGKGIEGGYYTGGLYTSMGFSYEPKNVNTRFIATAVISKVSNECDNTELYVFARNKGGEGPMSHSNGRCYRVTIKKTDTDEIMNDFIPCYKIDDGTVGMYDLVGQKFIAGGTILPGETLVAGPDIDRYDSPVAKSLYTRIIVAGGGGGGNNSSAPSVTSTNNINYAGYGGGVYGGYVSSNEQDPYNNKYASQEEGYSFGTGMTATSKTSDNSYGSEGAGGGGGGWYGGYASDGPNLAYSAVNGGGGSGYVLTTESYKPEHYMEGWEDYCLTDTFMDSIGEEEAKIIVCAHVDIFSDGDTLIFPCVKRTEKITLPQGKYMLKCWGGNGGPRFLIESSARGGYAEGLLTLSEAVDVFVTVGGSGISPGDYASFASIYRPTTAFNGGGQAGDLTSIKSTFGGGASDIRIIDDDLYSRVIVAGGAGGHGSAESSGNRFGGEGGGEMGGTAPSGNSVASPGPGTQTESPITTNATYETINGSFGQGGNGYFRSSGYGGAGGGGWYGGSGTAPDGSGDNDRGGHGGSGYVLTKDSNKPVGYKLDERFYLTDTTLKTGGNNLIPIGKTKIEIDVLESAFVNVLCKDDEGIKYFNTDEGLWVLCPIQKLTIDAFEKYGVPNVKNDIGLLDSYEVYIYEANDKIGSIDFYVVPTTQKINVIRYTPLTISQLIADVDIYDDFVRFEVSSKRRGVAENARIELTITANMTDIPSTNPRMYCVQAYTNGGVSGQEPNPREKTLDHIDLLPVGIGNKMPSRYKPYLGGGYINGDEAIETITTAVSCERNRSIYSAVLCNNKVHRFVKLNLVTNKSTLIKDIPKSSINTYIGDILVDDNYIYITSSDNNGQRTLWRTSLDPEDTSVNSYSPGTSSDYNFNAFGKMEWYNSHTIIINYKRGFMLFDTETTSWTLMASPSMNNARADMAIGKKYAITIYQGNSTDMWMCELETNTWLGSNADYGISWPSSQACCCYADGKFYITIQNYLYIIDEETMTLDDTIVTPYSATNPRSITYGGGVLYITIQNSSTLYLYDISSKRFSTAYLPFTIGTFTANGWCRPISFRGYFFIPNMRMYVINFVEYAKYNLGYKYDRLLFVTDKEHEPDYEYDERFVTFMDSNMIVHPGFISKDAEEYDVQNHISRVIMDKSQYNKLISARILEKVSGGEADEGGEAP